MKNEVVAKPYARALFSLAGAAGKEEQLAQQLGQVAIVWDGDAAFRQFIRRPEVPKKAKHEAIARLFPNLDPIALRLLYLVVDKQREDVFSTIYEQYRDLWDASRGIVHAEVTTAASLKDEEQQDLIAALSRATGRTVQIRVKRDPSLLGGAVVRLGDRVLDGSVARRLVILGDRLKSGDGGGSVVEQH
jgi:F-type H+-transporting ATPase subunit delta